MRKASWTWPWACIRPPISPNAISGAIGVVAKPGMIVWNGRLPGPTYWHGRAEHEAGAAVLQRDAGAGHDDARAEAHVVGLDVRDHHPVASAAAR